jgi:outer membrane protein OmpA-like peptidoglycan-associated protein
VRKLLYLKTIKIIMKTLKTIVLSFAIAISTFSYGQTSENPWAIAVGADLIGLQGDNVDSGLNFGAPALSLSRYIGAGFSIGAQYALNNLENNNEELKYSSIDGIVKYNLSEGKILPYLFAGYGFSRFADGTEKDGSFPSTETNRTGLGGIGVNFYLDDNFAINVSTSYRGNLEGDTYNHLQHIVGLSYKFGAGDADKDGVPDQKDVCPDIPGLKEFDGCPDTDGDGIPDNKDRCPEEAGTEALQGCPDTDGDGIADQDDACPDKAGPAAMNGCPDSDGDGVADNEDRCPETAGDSANGGCPWTDSDGDGVPDKDDNCPDLAGTVANNGCPDEPTDLVNFINSEDNIILFRASSDLLDSDDKEILNTVKGLLDKYPNANITIEGYASSDGSEAYNMKLSEKRAASVQAYLISNGIDAARLSTKGYGETNLTGDNNTVKGRAQSRRAKINRSAKVSIK